MAAKLIIAFDITPLQAHRIYMAGYKLPETIVIDLGDAPLPPVEVNESWLGPAGFGQLFGGDDCEQ